MHEPYHEERLLLLTVAGMLRCVKISINLKK